MNFSIDLEGDIRLTVRRPDGSIRLRRQAKNAIDDNLKHAVATHLFTGAAAGTYVSVDQMEITVSNGTFSDTTLTLGAGQRTPGAYECRFQQTFTCSAVTSGSEASITDVKLESSGNTQWASHSFTPAVDDIQASEQVTIDYTLRAGTASGVSDLLRGAVAATFYGSSTLHRVQYLVTDGLTGQNIAAVKATPSISGYNSTGGSQAADATNHTATCTNGVIVIRNNTAGGANDAGLPSMTTADATKAYLTQTSATVPANDAAALAFADITNVKQNDKLDLQFTLTIS
jgi:hypothetical protein|tara:strand:+ start:3470 stop:4330 length:861 start_codon:yes stop_codon:yes gene_type:complete